MFRLRARAFAAGLVAAGSVSLACVGAAGPAVAEPPPVIDPGDGGDYDPDIDPDAFVEEVDNPYLPLVPGSRWVYESEDRGEVETIEVVVTDQRRDIMGVSAVVVRDTARLEGELVEDTFDWFAQDEDGNVWYLGEDTKEYEDGEVVSTEGSWEAGIDGAEPGIVMLADPEKGDAYRQEFDEGNAEDMAEVRRVGKAMLATWEWTPLEPDVVEEKQYEPGIGVVREIVRRGGHGRVELVEFTPGT